MAARYYFDLQNDGDFIRDHDGVDADDLDQAIEQASAGVRDMRLSGEIPGSADGWELIIRDETGNEMKRISV